MIDLLPRAVLGRDLVMVSLVMEEEEVRQRLSERHPGQESVVQMLMVTSVKPHYYNVSIIALSNLQTINKLCLDPGEEEDRVVVVKVDPKMTREDVVQEILKKTDQYI